MKKLAYIFLICFPSLALGENVKLSCNLNLTDNYSTGNSTPFHLRDHPL